MDEGSVITSNVKNKKTNVPSDIVLETKPKRFGIVPKFLLLKADCFYFVQVRLGYRFFVSFLLDIGTFVECLSNVCSFTVLTLLVMTRPAMMVALCL
jgi:hypothetical protein